MASFRKVRRRVNVDAVTTALLNGQEMGWAEDDGITDENAQAARASRILKPVMKQVGKRHFDEVFVRVITSYSAEEMKDKAINLAATKLVFEESGYLEARRRIFPDLPPPRFHD
jgi:hypothetical protein